ncbi:unnamed protein product [Pneumocystis jirovecii]|uniref:Uncharacterized protein n=1 Tax=Pneumocystis jirovecii TaxID=42068 RepID=L0PB55_PNEJI|nr:unnamed protein product [Pneumocystis jirovecii]
MILQIGIMTIINESPARVEIPKFKNRRIEIEMKKKIPYNICISKACINIGYICIDKIHDLTYFAIIEF